MSKMLLLQSTITIRLVWWDSDPFTDASLYLSIINNNYMNSYSQSVLACYNSAMSSAQGGALLRSLLSYISLGAPYNIAVLFRPLCLG
jgi:hypothetical protein